MEIEKILRRTDAQDLADAKTEIERLRAALREATTIALGTDLTREALYRIKELNNLGCGL